ncbi:hypothetical protein GCM10020331_083850 [Ectobacillus funiculus]
MKKLFTSNLRMKIGILVFCLVFFLSSAISGGMLVEKVLSATENEQGQRALSIARSVAELEPIINNVGQPDGAKSIQPVVEKNSSCNRCGIYCRL